MPFDEELKRQIGALLNEIATEQSLSYATNSFEFDIGQPSTLSSGLSISTDRKRKLLYELQKLGAIKLKEILELDDREDKRNLDKGMILKDTYETLPPTRFTIEISRKKFAALREKYPDIASAQSTHRLIEKGQDGNYFFIGKIMELPKGAIWYDAFDILFTEADPDGFISYGKLDRGLAGRGHGSLQDKKKQHARIQNALTNKAQGFIRRARVGGKSIGNKTPKGERIIICTRGRGVKLNNPIL